jgi:hypothetical protein
MRVRNLGEIEWSTRHNLPNTGTVCAFELTLDTDPGRRVGELILACTVSRRLISREDRASDECNYVYYNANDTISSDLAYRPSRTGILRALISDLSSTSELESLTPIRDWRADSVLDWELKEFLSRRQGSDSKEGGECPVDDEDWVPDDDGDLEDIAAFNSLPLNVMDVLGATSHALYVGALPTDPNQPHSKNAWERTVVLYYDAGAPVASTSRLLATIASDLSRALAKAKENPSLMEALFAA